MRKLEGHKVNPANDVIEIAVTDEPGAGGANHRYEVTGYDGNNNPSREPGEHWVGPLILMFQNGPINEAGVNGITHEVLLAILVDRMSAFQAGPYACHENAMALTCLHGAQEWLHARTKGRMAAGIEGTHAVGAETERFVRPEPGNPPDPVPPQPGS